MTATTAGRPRTGGNRARPVRRVLLVVAVALAVLAAGWWSTHPRVFEEPANGISIVGRVGTPAYFGVVSIPSGESVHLIDVSPRVVSNGASAAVDVVVCRQSQADPGGEVTEAIESQCESVRSPVGRADGQDHLVVEVVAQAPGTVVVEGVDVTYRTTFQRGSQVTGFSGTVVVEP